jgi:hypothetical protein
MWHLDIMPAINVPLTEEELEAFRVDAAAAGKSLKEHAHDILVREGQRRAFITAAGEAFERLLPEFQKLCPEDLPTELRNCPVPAKVE